MRNANVEGLLLTGFDVMERRGRGEKILATQAMFTPGASYRATDRLPSAQGDGDDPIDVVLTRSTVRPTVMTVGTVLRLPETTPHVASRTVGNWWVQLGQFKNHQGAKTQIEAAARKFPNLFDDAEGAVDSRSGAFQARFSGFTEAAAKQACATVKAQQLPCIVGGGA